MGEIKQAKVVINVEEKMLDIALEYLADSDMVMFCEDGNLRRLNKEEWRDYVYRRMWEKEDE